MTERRLMQEVLDSLPQAHGVSVLGEINGKIEQHDHTVFVLDDDPTGTQTVHDVPVLTQWSEELLVAELTSGHPVVYILTNARSMTAEDAIQLNHEIACNIRNASEKAKRRVSIISRSDSTLRGHYPQETNTLQDVFDGLFDNVLLIPAFFEGGRLTINDIHYVITEQWLIPASETEFARDASFGYHHSDLKQWIEEKTQEHISAADVASISISTIRNHGAARVADYLLQLKPGQVCIINAATYNDLEIATLGIMQAESAGKQFLFRTAASFVRTYAGQSDYPLLSSSQLTINNDHGGLIIVGSYVAKTSTQLQQLLNQTSIYAIEVSVERLLNRDTYLDELNTVTKSANEKLQAGSDVVIFTSRTLVTGSDIASNLSIGERISESLVQIMQGIEVTPRFIIAKGGITSSDIATKGLGIKRAMVMGQVLPGIPVWKTGNEARFPDMPYMIFPGNVGTTTALAEVVAQLNQRQVH